MTEAFTLSFPDSMSFSWDLYCLLLFLPIAFLILLRYTASRSRTSEKLPLPPSPPSWPVVGHLFQVGRKLHVRFAEFSQQYGPLISIRLGSVFMVVASTPEAASEVLRTQDRLLAGRPLSPFLMHKDVALNGGSIMWASECDEKWKSLRAMCQTQLFSATAIQSQSSLREKKAAQMVEYLRSMEGQVVSIPEVLSTTILNALSNLFFSDDFFSFEAPEGISIFREQIKSFLELVTTPTVADFYPSLEALDINGVGKQVVKDVKIFHNIWKATLDERRRSFSPEAHQHNDDVKVYRDLMDSFLANNFSDDKINALILTFSDHELLLAGSDANVTTVEWAMTELIRNRGAMQKLKQELSQALSGKGNSVKESLLSDLPYLQACIKETFRLHPAVPLLLPHRAVEECKVMNYRVPKDSRVIINVWAIGRNPAVWEDPLCFKPERFLDCKTDFRGQDFELLPFGSGRRTCPGYPFATKQIALLLSSLVAFFDWDLPDGGDAAQLDVNEKFSLTLCKEQPLLVVPKPVLP